MADDKLMRGLGWLSLSLSIPPLLMPKSSARHSVSATPPAPSHRGSRRSAGTVAGIFGYSHLTGGFADG
jgi:hypothetical protein